MAAMWRDDACINLKERKGKKMRVLYITSTDEIRKIQKTLMEGFEKWYINQTEH